MLAGIALAAWAFPAHAQLPRLEWGGGTPVDFSFADPNTRSAAQTVRYINAGAVPATLGAMAASDEFVIAPGSTCAPGQTLAPQASCTLQHIQASIALAVSLCTSFGSARAFDDAKYPSLEGQWLRTDVGTPRYDPSRPAGRYSTSAAAPAELRSTWPAADTT